MKIRIEIRSDDGCLQEILEKNDLNWITAGKWFKHITRMFFRRHIGKK